MTPKLGNLDDIDWDEPKAIPTIDDRVRELIEWADKQPPETFED